MSIHGSKYQTYSQPPLSLSTHLNIFQSPNAYHNTRARNHYRIKLQSLSTSTVKEAMDSRSFLEVRERVKIRTVGEEELRRSEGGREPNEPFVPRNALEARDEAIEVEKRRQERIRFYCLFFLYNREEKRREESCSKRGRWTMAFDRVVLVKSWVVDT